MDDDNLVYTELHPCSIQCAQESYYVPSNADSDENHLLHEFLSSSTSTGQDYYHSQSQNDIPCSNMASINNFIHLIEDKCNGLPKETFMSELVNMCCIDDDVTSLEQLRQQYFTIAKQRPDFPYPSAVLKKRVQPKTKGGESLMKKLCRDCFTLRMATKGDFLEDLKEALNVKSTRNSSLVDSDLISSSTQKTLP